MLSMPATDDSFFPTHQRLGIPSGKRLHNELGNHHAIDGKINYKWAISNSYACLPEGNITMEHVPYFFTVIYTL